MATNSQRPRRRQSISGVDWQQQQLQQCSEEIERLQREKQHEIDMAGNPEWREQLRRELEAEISRRVREALDTPPGERHRRSRELARLKASAAAQKERELAQLRLAAAAAAVANSPATSTDAAAPLRFYGDQQLLRRTATTGETNGFRLAATPGTAAASSAPASSTHDSGGGGIVRQRFHGNQGYRRAVLNSVGDFECDEDDDDDDDFDEESAAYLPMIPTSRQLTCLRQPLQPSPPPVPSTLRQGLEAMRHFGDLSQEERLLLFSNFTRDAFRQATTGGGRMPDGSALAQEQDGRYRDQYGILRDPHGPFWPSDFGPCHPAPRHRRLPSPEHEPLLLPLKNPASSESQAHPAQLGPRTTAPNFPSRAGCEPPVTADSQRTEFAGRWRGTQIVFDSERCPRHYAPPAVAEDTCPSLVFESRFESGNLRQVRRVGMFEYELVLRTDLYTKRHTQWFYFRVQNPLPRIVYKFVIVNLLKPTSLYSDGMRPLLYSEKSAAACGLGWHRAGHHIRYSRNVTRLQSVLLHREMAYYQLEWQMEFPHAEDSCYVAHCYPYTYSDLRDDLLAIRADERRRRYVREEVLCETRAGNSCFLLTVTEPGPEPAGSEKCGVVVTARVHPGEANSSWMMKGLIEFLTGESQTAAELRRHFVFKLVPMLNPDGVIVGNYRTSLAGRDLNRNYRHPRREAFPTVYHTKQMLERLQRERRVLLYCDLHGHSRKPDVFMYGCDSQYREVDAEQVNSVKLQVNPAGFLNERLLPWLMSRCSPGLFSFSGCRFSIRRCKEATGRVVVWRQFGIENSFTMEATFCGTSAAASDSRHFNTGDLESMGHALASALWQYRQVKADPARQASIVVDMTCELLLGLLGDRGALARQDRELSVDDASAPNAKLEKASLVEALRTAVGGNRSGGQADAAGAEARRWLGRLNPSRLMEQLALESVDDCGSVLRQLNISSVEDSDSSDSDSESEPELPPPAEPPTKKRRRRAKKKADHSGKKRNAKDADRRKTTLDKPRVSFSSVVEECSLPDPPLSPSDCQTEENDQIAVTEDLASAARKSAPAKPAVVPGEEAGTNSISAGGRVKVKQFPMFVSKFEGRTNNGIPCFSEERLLERANRKIYSLHSRLNQERGRDIIYSQHVEELPGRETNASLASLEEIRYRLQHLLASQEPQDEAGNDSSDSDADARQLMQQHQQQLSLSQQVPQQHFTVVRPVQSIRPARVLQRRRSLAHFSRALTTTLSPSLDSSLSGHLPQSQQLLTAADPTAVLQALESVTPHGGVGVTRSRTIRPGLPAYPPVRVNPSSTPGPKPPRFQWQMPPGKLFRRNRPFQTGATRGAQYCNHATF